ncbi:MAG: VWA domain-containing protein [Acutalibacteraceae bacterium]
MKKHLKSSLLLLISAVLMLCALSVSAFAGSSTPNDIVFVIDSTGSMESEITFLQNNLFKYINTLDLGEKPYKIALIDYKDFPSRDGSEADDYPYKVLVNLTNDSDKIQEGFNKLSASGGGDDKETVYSALINGLNEISWTSGSKRTVILLGDAAPLDPEPNTGYTLSKVTSSLNSKNIKVHTISISDSEISEFASIASSTGGKSLNGSTTVRLGVAVANLISSIVSDEHVYGEPTWSWSGVSSATATFVCTECYEQVEKKAAITDKVTKKPTCSATGIRTYTAKVTLDGISYTDTKTQSIAKLSHSYGNPVWKWSGEKATAVFTCSVGNETKSVSAAVTKSVNKKATLSSNGSLNYTAKVTFNSKTYTALKSSTIYSIKSVSLSSTSYVYNKSVRTPKVTVKDSKGNVLKNGTDYSVKYSSGRTNPGTYKVLVTFKGNYSGSKTLSYKIYVGKVTGIKQTKQTGYALAIEWNKVQGASGYVVQKYDSNKKKWVTVGTAKSTKIGFKSYRGTNKWRVRAKVVIGSKTYYGEYSSTLKTKS